jgi:metal-sulfur cluster biosynthetic enzyme
VSDPQELQQAILQRLMTVIDPETNIDVVRMRLVQDLTVDAQGKVSYIFRPSSPLCPIAVPLALSILRAIAEVEGVSGQQLTVMDYVGADELNEIINAVFS